MDLILLEPGDQSLFGGGKNGWATGGSLIEGGAGDAGVAPASWCQSYPFTKGNLCIEITSLHQGMKQQMTTDVSNSARTSGRPIITEFTCVKYVDKASVKFYDYCLRAQPLGTSATGPTKIYICRNSGQQLLNIMTFSLRDAMISEIQFQTHPNDMPTEQFKLNFAEVLWTFSIQLANTGTPGNVTAGWSLARNAPIAAFSG